MSSRSTEYLTLSRLTTDVGFPNPPCQGWYTGDRPGADGGDYTLTVYLSIDRQDDRHDADGMFRLENHPPFFRRFCIEAGRKDGAWRLRVLPWDGDHHDDMLGEPPVLELSDQREGEDPLMLLRALLSVGGAKHSITINDIHFDPATAEYVSGHPGGDYHFDPGPERRFDEHLYKTPEGYWFILRPLAPDEVRAWMKAHDDNVLLKRTFPDEDAD